MLKPLSAARKGRLYSVLLDWFEEQVRRGELQPGDRLPPERKLGEQFGISRTAVREALRELAARGLIESHVGRGTFVRLPSVGHLSQKLRTLHDGEEHKAREALLHVVAALVELAAARHTPEMLSKLRNAIEHMQPGGDAFLHCLGETAENPMLGTLARALAQIAAQGTSSSQTATARRLVALITARDADGARRVALGGCLDEGQA